MKASRGHSEPVSVRTARLSKTFAVTSRGAPQPNNAQGPRSQGRLTPRPDGSAPRGLLCLRPAGAG
eukprot:3566417-Lingulodinium_polyedra.AAC.1